MKDKQDGLFNQQRQSPTMQGVYTPDSTQAPVKIKHWGFWSFVGVVLFSILGFLIFLEIFAPVDLKPTTYVYAFYINKTNLVVTETASPLAEAEALKAKRIAEEQAKVEQRKTYIITKFTHEFELYKNCIDQRRSTADQARVQCMTSFDSTFSDCDLMEHGLESKPCPPKPVLTAEERKFVGDALPRTYP